MTTVQILLPKTTAEKYQQLTEQQKDVLSALISDSLSESPDLLEVMDYISFKAQKRGLTPDILNELLAE